MKILVTGGAGFIGSNLIRKLLELPERHSIMNVDLLTYAGNITSTSDYSDDPRYELRCIDIADSELVAKAFSDFQPDSVMHLAAESHVDRSISGPSDFIRTNITGTFNLLEQSRKYLASKSNDFQQTFRFHHISTDEVYGSLGEDGFFTESTPYDPRSPYSASKAASDHLVRAWHHTYGLNVLITNCSNNYGPYQFPEKLIPIVIIKALTGQPIPVYGEGKNVRDWLYVDDHASALIQVLTKGRPGETYNIGGNSEKRNIEIVNCICEILNEALPTSRDYKELITFVQDRPGHDLRYAIDASKIKTELNWTPSITSEQGIRKTVDWYLENREWWQDILDKKHSLDRLGLISK